MSNNVIIERSIKRVENVYVKLSEETIVACIVEFHKPCKLITIIKYGRKSDA